MGGGGSTEARQCGSYSSGFMEAHCGVIMLKRNLKLHSLVFLHYGTNRLYCERGHLYFL